MALRIVFHDQPSDGRRLYSTGEKVTGHVEVDIKPVALKDQITKINLFFSCRSKIGITRSAGHHRYYFNCKSMLFSRRYLLVSPTFEVADSHRGEDGGTLKFPFELTIPEFAEAVGPDLVELHRAEVLTSGRVWPATAAYFDQDPQSQPLPDVLPNFHTMGTFPGSAVDGSVIYKVRAEVPNLGADWQRLWIGKMEQDAFLAVVNLKRLPSTVAEGPVQWRDLKFKCDVRTLKLLPNHAESHLSILERTRGIFNKSALPSLELELAFSAPRTLFIDAADQLSLPFFLSVCRTNSHASEDPSLNTLGLDEKHNEISESVDPYTVTTPKVYLDRMRVILVAHSEVRTNPHTRRYMDPGENQAFQEHEIFDYKHNAKAGERVEIPLIDPLNAARSSRGSFNEKGSSQVSSSKPMQFNIGEQLGITHELLRNIPRSYDIVPDFATPNLVRKYFLQWDIRLDVCGEEVRWSAEREEQGLGVRVERGGSGGAENVMSISTGRNDEGPGFGVWGVPPAYQYQDQGEGGWVGEKLSEK